MNYPRILSFDELPLSCYSINYPRILSFDERSPYPVILRTNPVSFHSINYPRILSFDELPLSCHSMNYPYPVIR
jgi:hypothetical protein